MWCAFCVPAEDFTIDLGDPDNCGIVFYFAMLWRGSSAMMSSAGVGRGVRGVSAG